MMYTALVSYLTTVVVPAVVVVMVTTGVDGHSLSRRSNCPVNQKFHKCGSACAPNCDKSLLIAACFKTCTEGCRCEDSLMAVTNDDGQLIECVSEDKCQTTSCPNGLVWTDHGCKVTLNCEAPNRRCSGDKVSRCQCPDSRPIQHLDSQGNVICISREDCPVCTGGRVWKACHRDCTKTCTDPNPSCSRACKSGCQCPSSKPFWHQNKCVRARKCRRGKKKL